MTENPSLVGKDISGCEILNKVAEGGMGAVYKARHKALNRIVCVKILSPALANDKKAVELFLTEARAIAELDHPNIVNVYNVGKEKGYYFIVMSFIEGQTLSMLLKRNYSRSYIAESPKLSKTFCSTTSPGQTSRKDRSGKTLCVRRKISLWALSRSRAKARRSREAREPQKYIV